MQVVDLFDKLKRVWSRTWELLSNLAVLSCIDCLQKIWLLTSVHMVC